MTVTVSHQAYLKLVFHASKYPYKSVNGLLIGTEDLVTDVIPLLHTWTSLSPTMEIALDLAGRHASSVNQKIVGYYQASERVDDVAFSTIGERVANKIKDSFKDAIVFVVDNDALSSGNVALIPYVSQGNLWRRSTDPSTFRLSSVHSPTVALGFIRDERLQEKLYDFDDHLVDTSLDWLGNKACLPQL